MIFINGNLSDKDKSNNYKYGFKNVAFPAANERSIFQAYKLTGALQYEDHHSK